MLRKFVLAAVGATAIMAGPMLSGVPAFAAAGSNSPPEPYTAPDPVYTQHKVDSSVDMTQPKSTATLTGNQPAAGTVAKAR